MHSDWNQGRFSTILIHFKSLKSISVFPCNDVQRHTAFCSLYFSRKYFGDLKPWGSIVPSLNQGSVDRSYFEQVLEHANYQYLNRYCFNEHFMIWPLDLKTKCLHQKLIKSAYSNLSNDHLWPILVSTYPFNLTNKLVGSP